MFHMQDVEVDPKAATWLCYTMPSESQEFILNNSSLKLSTLSTKLTASKISFIQNWSKLCLLEIRIFKESVRKSVKLSTHIN